MCACVVGLCVAHVLCIDIVKPQIKYLKPNPRFCNVLLYCPQKCEVDINYVTKNLLKNKKYQIFVPKIQKISFDIVKYRLPLLKNRFNIKEPKSSKIYKNKLINIAIVPALGVDKEMKRIGFGKGMYDRFFETLKVKPYSIFVSRREMIADKILSDSHDIKADRYIAAKKYTIKKASKIGNKHE